MRTENTNTNIIPGKYGEKNKGINMERKKTKTSRLKKKKDEKGTMFDFKAEHSAKQNTCRRIHNDTY